MLASNTARRSMGPSALPVALALVVGLASCAGKQAAYLPMPVTPPTPGGADAVLYLVGDGGEANQERAAVLEHLSADVEELAGEGGPPVLVAFLGDNIYDDGAPADPSASDLERLSGQIRAIPAAPNVQGVFVPGNHDWADGAALPYGRTAMARQRAWIEDMSEGRDLRLLPDDGCPGPATEDVAGVHLVFIDTEWLLRTPEERCGTADAFYQRLEADLREHRDRIVVLLSHHPLVSGGPHGGNVSLLDRGPLVYYLAVKSGALRQDLGSPAYGAMRRGIGDAILASGAQPLIHAAGHDHTLQVIRTAGLDLPQYQLVSGALSRTENAARIDGTRYAANGYGYIRLAFYGDEAGLVVFRREPSGGTLAAVFGCTITRAAPPGECPAAPLAIPA